MKGRAYFETKKRLYEVFFENSDVKSGSFVDKSNGERTTFDSPDLRTLLDLSSARQIQKVSFSKKLSDIENGNK